MPSISLFLSFGVLICNFRQVRGQPTINGCPLRTSGGVESFGEDAERNDRHHLEIIYQSLSSRIERIENMLQVAIQSRMNDTYGSPKGKECPSGFDYLPESNGCFKLILQLFNWSRAGEVCRRVMPGVHLAAITSAAKQSAMRRYLQQEFQKSGSSTCSINAAWPGAGKSIWIGAQTKNPNQCGTPYVWKTLEAVEIDFNYTNWNAGEPTCRSLAELGKPENCVHVLEGYGYSWNDTPCTRMFCALCEY